MISSMHGFLLISFCVAYFSTSCHAASTQRFNNPHNKIINKQASQRLESAYPTPYSGVGFRPEVPFELPNSSPDQRTFLSNELPQFDGNNNNFNFLPNSENNFNSATEQFELLYGTPAAEPSRLRLQSSRIIKQLPLQIQQRPAHQIGISSFNSKPARLTDERRERELIEDNPTDMELDMRNDYENISVTTAAQPATTPTIAYNPVGSFGFYTSPAIGRSPVPSPVQAPLQAYVQYPSNGLISPTAKFIVAPAPAPAQLQITYPSTYYAATKFAPQSLAFTAYPQYAAGIAGSPAPSRAW